MIPRLNFVVLMVSSALFLLYYLKSVRPASLENRIGPAAYQKCARYRLVSSEQTETFESMASALIPASTIGL